VPVNIVQKVMGHEQASTTLNRYVHAPADFGQRVVDAFKDSDAFSLPLEVVAPNEKDTTVDEEQE
jgi:hypothetical protein